MRPYPGINPQTEEDGARRDKFRRLDYYLRDLEKAISRLQQGEVPDGSGTPLLDPTLNDIYLVLRGRPGNQVAHGGTMSGGKLTLSSTLHPTKGKVYLGEAEISAYDETNERIGVQTASPAARLHLKHIAGGGTQTVYPQTGIWEGGWGVAGGGGDYSVATQTNDGTTSFVQGPDNGNPRSGFKVALTTPTIQSTSGWTLHIVARKAGGTTGCVGVNLQLKMASYSAGSFPAFDFNSGGIIDEIIFNETGNTLGSLTTSYVDYSRSMSTAEMASLAAGITNNPTFYVAILISTKGTATQTAGVVPEVTQIYLTGPGTLDSTPLQKWENTTTSNTLNYAADGAGATVLEYAGTPKFRVGSATNIEIASGSPASGMVGVATDTDGTFAWASASSLATKVQHRFVANGYYRSGTDVDGAWIARTSMTLSKVLLYRRQGGSAGSTTVDLMKNGTSVLSSAPSIAASAAASSTASGTITTTSIAVGDRFTVNATADSSGRPQDWMLEIEAF